MDGENNGKTLLKFDDLGWEKNPLFLEKHPCILISDLSDQLLGHKKWSSLKLDVPCSDPGSGVHFRPDSHLFVGGVFPTHFDKIL